jgi:hypothetical protein
VIEGAFLENYDNILSFILISERKVGEKRMKQEKILLSNLFSFLRRISLGKEFSPAPFLKLFHIGQRCLQSAARLFIEN